MTYWISSWYCSSFILDLHPYRLTLHTGELRNFHIIVSLERGVIWKLLNGDTTFENSQGC